MQKRSESREMPAWIGIVVVCVVLVVIIVFAYRSFAPAPIANKVTVISPSSSGGYLSQLPHPPAGSNYQSGGNANSMGNAGGAK